MSITNRLRSLAGVNHGSQDAIVLPGEDVQLLAQFAYGPFAFRLLDEEVHAYLHNCSRWQRLHHARTDASGRVQLQAAIGQLAPGTYSLGFSVPGDGSVAHATLWVLPPGQHFVVFNIDGTLTSAPPASFYSALGGQAYYSQLADRLAPGLRQEAAELTRVWAAKGYRVLYLTARPLHLRQVTERWLRAHDFAVGALHMAEGAFDALPYNGCVGGYKARFLASLQQMGHHLDVAYGATSTDMYAYKQVGIAQLYVVGTVPMETTAARLLLLGGHLETLKEETDEAGDG